MKSSPQAPFIRRRLAFFVALLVAGLSVAIALRFGAYAAIHSDASGYVSEGELWRTGELYRPTPLQLWATWPNAAVSGSPLGFRPSTTSGTEVPFYPPGFPLLVASAVSLGGDLAAYAVAPLMSGAFVFCSFLLARRLAGDTAGIVAAVLLAVNPVTLYHGVHPMSDVPAAACWVAAWYFALWTTWSGAVASGTITALAVLIRPNLAPLALVPFALVLLSGAGIRLRTWLWRDAALFGAAASLGPLFIAWTQLALYGHPFQPGYPGFEAFFKIEHIWPNLRGYPSLFVDVLGWPPLIGLAMPVLAVRRSELMSREARAVTLSAAAMIALNVVIYLPYLPVDFWPFLRFFLPAIAGVFVLFAAALARLGESIWRRRGTRWLSAGCVALTAVVAGHRTDLMRYALNDWRAQALIPIMGHYLRETLPPNAVVLSFIHSGAIAHYTGHNVVRLDLVEPSSLDRIVDDLERYGCRPVFVIDEVMEGAQFRSIFKTSEFGSLDWPARAEFTTVSRTRYFVASDRERFRAGARWVTDVLH